MVEDKKNKPTIEKICECGQVIKGSSDAHCEANLLTHKACSKIHKLIMNDRKKQKA